MVAREAETYPPDAHVIDLAELRQIRDARGECARGRVIFVVLYAERFRLSPLARVWTGFFADGN